VEECAALFVRESEVRADSHADHCGTHRVTQRLTLGQVERVRHRTQHLGEPDPAVRSLPRHRLQDGARPPPNPPHIERSRGPEDGRRRCPSGQLQCRSRAGEREQVRRHARTGGKNNAHTGTGVGSGAEGSRTPDLCSAIAALSQLSYSPVNRALNIDRRPPRGKPQLLQPPRVGVAIVDGRGYPQPSYSAKPTSMTIPSRATTVSSNTARASASSSGASREWRAEMWVSTNRFTPASRATSAASRAV